MHSELRAYCLVASDTGDDLGADFEGQINAGSASQAQSTWRLGRDSLDTREANRMVKRSFGFCGLDRRSLDGKSGRLDFGLVSTHPLMPIDLNYREVVWDYLWRG